MSEKKKDRPWDGRSRIPTQQYKENYNEIFKKSNTSPQNGSKPITHLRNRASALIFKLARK
jgi:hypothetical protein